MYKLMPQRCNWQNPVFSTNIVRRERSGREDMETKKKKRFGRHKSQLQHKNLI